MDVLETGVFRGHAYRLVRSLRELHGWWPGLRECTAERLLVNPYSGCTHRCRLCYSNAFPFSHYRHFRRTGQVTVAERFDRYVARQLDSIDWASCGYLSPVADPFQPLEHKFGLSERIVQAFTARNIPIEFITKGLVPETVLSIMARQEHSFGQVSILTPDEEQRRKLCPGGATTEELFQNLENIAGAARPAGFSPMASVLRIDPVYPYINDDPNDIDFLLKQAFSRGSRHVIISCLDVPLTLKNHAFDWMYSMNQSPPVPYEELYSEKFGPRLHASVTYRNRLFSTVRDLTVQTGMSFALCMEYERCLDQDSGQSTLTGMNSRFMTGTDNCEGVNIPVYRRKGTRTYRPERGGSELPVFIPATPDCTGNCLACSAGECGNPDLPQAGKCLCRGWKLSDYRRWSRLYRGND